MRKYLKQEINTYKMKNKTLILPFLFIGLLSNCQNKNTVVKNNVNNVEKKSANDCKAIFRKFNEKLVVEENDSAFYYLDKAIECDPKNNSFKYSKVKFLTNIKKYEDAIKQLDELTSNSTDPSLKMQKGILKLKINAVDSKNVLEKCYAEFNQIEKPTSSNSLYKIALDNYFKGKEYSLNKIKKFRQEYMGKPYETDNINALEELIKKESKENVLFKLFDIND